MIQRGSSTMTRNLLIGTISVLLLLVVLYYMKRVEVGRLKHSMDDLLLQRSDREDELNRKLTEYLQKLEDMTRQLGDINSRLQECEDNKASVVMEVQKCKSVHSECLSTKDGADTSLKAAQVDLNRLKSQVDTLNTQLTESTHSIANVQHSLTVAEQELEQCEKEKDTYASSLRDSNAQLQECNVRDMQCQGSLKSQQSNVALPAAAAPQPAQPYAANNYAGQPRFPAPRNPAPAQNIYQPQPPQRRELPGPPGLPALPVVNNNQHPPAQADPATKVASSAPSQDDGTEDGADNPLLEGLEELHNSNVAEDAEEVEGNDAEEVEGDERVIGDVRGGDGVIGGPEEHGDEQRPIVIDDEEERVNDGGAERVIDGGAEEEAADREKALADENLV